MITLEYWNSNEWVKAGEFWTEQAAWISLGTDNENYRTVDETGEELRNTKIESHDR